MHDPENPPDMEYPRPASLPVRITREVAVPVVAIAYLLVLSFLVYSGKLSESSFVAMVLTPVGGYLGSLVPKMKQEAR